MPPASLLFRLTTLAARKVLDMPPLPHQHIEGSYQSLVLDLTPPPSQPSLLSPLYLAQQAVHYKNFNPATEKLLLLKAWTRAVNDVCSAYSH